MLNFVHVHLYLHIPFRKSNIYIIYLKNKENNLFYITLRSSAALTFSPSKSRILSLYISRYDARIRYFVPAATDDASNMC